MSKDAWEYTENISNLHHVGKV